MGKNKTEKCKWVSKYAPPGEVIYISDAQYLAEKMVEKRAKKDGVVLPAKFWNDPFYKKDFLFQLKKANDLLNNYDINILLEIFNHWRMRTVDSWGLLSVIDPLCREAKNRKNQIDKLSEEQKSPTEEQESRRDVPIFRAPSGVGGIRSKLRD